MAFQLTARQQEAQRILSGDATHLMLFGGSRSGKTFLLTRNVVMRALKAPNSRHAPHAISPATRSETQFTAAACASSTPSSATFCATA